MDSSIATNTLAMVGSGLRTALPQIDVAADALSAVSGLGNGQGVGGQGTDLTVMEAQHTRFMKEQVEMQMLMQRSSHESNISKSLHEAAMAIINNVRVR